MDLEAGYCPLCHWIDRRPMTYVYTMQIGVETSPGCLQGDRDSPNQT